MAAVGTLERSTGVETAKALAGALSVPRFTVDALAEATGVHRTTVDTVLRRYPEAFERLPTPKENGRKGRPPATWRVRDDHLDDMLSVVRSANVPRIPVPQDDQDVLASVLLAAMVLRRAPMDDPEKVKGSVTAARVSLQAAGLLDAEASPHATSITAHAALVARTADVLEAWAHGDARRLDVAQAEALTAAYYASQRVTAERWLPLAQRAAAAPGTILGAPVVVERSHAPLVRKLFPHMKLLRGRSPRGYVCLVDKRATWPDGDPVVHVLFPDDDPATRPRVAELLRQTPVEPTRTVVVSARPSVLRTAARLGAFPLRVRRSPTADTPQAVAQVVNHLAVGLGGLGLGLGAGR
jgi:hypothetical protein